MSGEQRICILALTPQTCVQSHCLVARSGVGSQVMYYITCMMRMRWIRWYYYHWTIGFNHRYGGMFGSRIVSNLTSQIVAIFGLRGVFQGCTILVFILTFSTILAVIFSIDTTATFQLMLSEITYNIFYEWMSLPSPTECLRLCDNRTVYQTHLLVKCGLKHVYDLKHC